MNEPIEITKIDIRTVWPGEARDFTPWMADHLDVLGDHLGIGELALEAIEVPIPGGRALDLLAVDAEGRKWAIENQYGIGDHDHLTRGLAYAVALECRAVVIVAEDHRDEFVAVAEEWNRYSEAYGTEGIRLFLVVVEAWRIGDSAPGFRFRLLSGPNEWVVEARSSAAKTAAQADRNSANLEFWTQVLPAMNERTNLFRPISPRTSPFIDVTSGAFGFQVWVKAESCRVQLRIDAGDADENEELFEQILEHREVVEERFGSPLTWNRADSHRACFVRYEVPGSAGWRTPLDRRAAGIGLVVDAMIRFHAALEPVVSGLE